MVKRISVKEAGEDFPRVLDSVSESQEPVIVQKQGQDFAVVISPKDYQQLVKEREERFSVFDRIWQANEDKDPEEVEEDVAREIAALRMEKALRSR